MKNKTLLLSLQKGILKELYLQGLLTEEQTKLAIKEFEKIYEKEIIERKINENEESSSIL